MRKIQCRNSIGRLLRYTIPIIIGSFIFNLPSFLAMHKLSNDKDQRDPEILYYNVHFYLWYKAVARLLVVAIVPFIVFFVMNFRIYFAIRNAKIQSSSAGCLELEQVSISSTFNQVLFATIILMKKYKHKLSIGKKLRKYFHAKL
jgi:hypothetical protein